jgi:hypothetical protein
MNAPAKDLKEVCDLLRADIEATAKRLNAIKHHSAFLTADISSEARGEMYANTVLAYRHLEDARMRLGKVLQHYEGGISKYDKASP